jgi:hypothetical protein
LKIYSNIIWVLLIIPCIGFSQTMYEVKDSKFHVIANSLIDSLSDLKLKGAIRYKRTWECYYDTSNFNSKNWPGSKSQKGVKVCYDFIDSCDQIYGYRTNRFRSSGFEIIFDFNYEIVKQPDFQFLNKVSQIHNKCFIDYDTAQSIAINNSHPKSRKTWTNDLVYDLVINKVYWLIERESGFRNGIIETIKIDAENKQIIEKTSTPFYKKGYFKALSDKIFKVP